MSVTGGIEHDAQKHASWPRRLAANFGTMAALLVRPPVGRRLRWPAAGRVIAASVLLMALLAVVMLWLDLLAIRAARQLPPGLAHGFDIITDFGKSGIFLWPIGLLLVGIAVLAVPRLSKMAQLTLTALSIRLMFLFIAIGLPSLLDTVLKRMIGRARPFVEGDNVFAYKPFVWRAAYASMPSGHGTTAFAVAIAIGAVWPWTRPLMWAYAVLIGLSRVALTAHHPSDVIASAVFGVIGALLIRNWFAARRLGFTIGTEGAVQRLPGPSWRRTKAVARRLVSA